MFKKLYFPKKIITLFKNLNQLKFQILFTNLQNLFQRPQTLVLTNKFKDKVKLLTNKQKA